MPTTLQSGCSCFMAFRLPIPPSFPSHYRTHWLVTCYKTMCKYAALLVRAFCFLLRRSFICYFCTLVDCRPMPCFSRSLYIVFMYIQTLSDLHHSHNYVSPQIHRWSCPQKSSFCCCRMCIFVVDFALVSEAKQQQYKPKQNKNVKRKFQFCSFYRNLSQLTVAC